MKKHLKIGVASSELRLGFAKRHLDPADRLEEILCGLIMVLDFTLIGGFSAGQGRAGVRHLLIAVLGCNIAWGIIDGALYVMGCLTARRQRLKFLTSLRDAPDENAAFAVLSKKLDPVLEPETHVEDRAHICRSLLPAFDKIQLPEAGVIKDDLYGMAAIFWIDFASVIPAVIPFFVFRDEPRFALRVSNALLIASLFVVGYMWGKYAGSKPYVIGCCTMLLGLALVGVAIALGG